MKIYELCGLSTTDQTYNFRCRYLLTPILGISAQAGYKKVSNPTLDYAMPFDIRPSTIIIIEPGAGGPGGPDKAGIPT